MLAFGIKNSFGTKALNNACSAHEQYPNATPSLTMHPEKVHGNSPHAMTTKDTTCCIISQPWQIQLQGHHMACAGPTNSNTGMTDKRLSPVSSLNCSFLTAIGTQSTPVVGWSLHPSSSMRCSRSQPCRTPPPPPRSYDGAHMQSRIRQAQKWTCGSTQKHGTLLPRVSWGKEANQYNPSWCRR